MPDMSVSSPGFLMEVVTASAVGASASPNVKGSWVELCTTTPWDADGIMVHLQINGTTVSCLMDFAVGGSGSEITIMENVLIQQTARLSTYIFIPINIPAGTRISARCQATTGSQAVAVQAHIYRGGLWKDCGSGRIVTLGAVTADSGGTGLDTGAASGTFTSWVELSSSLPSSLKAVFLMVGNQQNSAPTDQAGNFVLELGVGAAASEQTVFGGIRFGSGAAGFYGPLPAVWFPVSIPSGTRLSARAKSSVTDATDRRFDLVVYGILG